MTDFSITLIGPAAATYVMTNSSNERIIPGSRVYTHNENQPAKLVFQVDNAYTGAEYNLLNANFSGWSAGTGPLQVGHRVAYAIKPNSLTDNTLGALTTYFNGIIMRIEQKGAGILEIEARDDGEIYENLEPSKTYYTNYRDNVHTQYGIHGSKLALMYADSTGFYPGVAMEFLANDKKTGWVPDGTGTNWHTFDAANRGIAQPFICDFDGTYSYGFYWKGSVDTYSIRVGVQEDSGGSPSGTWLFYKIETLPAGSGGAWEYGIFDGTVYAVVKELERGKKYWFVMIVESITGGTVELRRDADATYAWDGTTRQCKSWNGTAWAAETGAVVAFISAGEYIAVPPKDYHYAYSAILGHLIVFDAFNGQLEDIGTDYTWSIVTAVLRGRYSYYYGTFEMHEMISALAYFGLSTVPGVDTDFSKELSVYRTKGKSLAACFTELADLYGCVHAGHNHQGCWGVYHDGTDVHLTFQRRLDSTDAAATTFSYGTDVADANDYQRRITSCNLERNVRTRANTVTVIGKSLDGGPLVAIRDDRGRTNSLRTQTGIPIYETIQDDSLNTLEMCSDRAWAYLDSMSREKWEGTITVSGVYPNLFGTDWAICQAKNISLNYSPLGISNELFHVVGIIVKGNTTEIQITNPEIRVGNAFTEVQSRGYRAESFQSPQDEEETKVLGVYKSTTVTDASVYMQLSSADSTPLTGSSRVLCTKLSSPTTSGNNINTYHGEFSKYNGSGTVERIEMYDAATGGSQVAYYDFSAETGTVAEFYKSKRCYVIIDFNCHAS